jgi:hypothetical protein
MMVNAGAKRKGMMSNNNASKKLIHIATTSYFTLALIISIFFIFQQCRKYIKLIIN